MLDMKLLEAMPPNTVFSSNIVLNKRLYNKPVRWVAIRGLIPDWAIYYDLAEKSIEDVKNYGNKCFTEEVIRELVPCDNESFGAYRY